MTKTVMRNNKVGCHTQLQRVAPSSQRTPQSTNEVGVPTGGGSKIGPVAGANSNLVTPTALSQTWSEQFVRNAVDKIVIVFHMHGYVSDGWSRKGTVDHWLECSKKVGDCVKFVKWKLAAFQSAVRSTADEPQDIPPSVLIDEDLDNPAVLLGGRAYRWFRRIHRQNSLEFDDLVDDLQYVKKIMPEVSDDYVENAEMKTFNELTTQEMEFDLLPVHDLTAQALADYAKPVPLMSGGDLLDNGARSVLTCVSRVRAGPLTIRELVTRKIDVREYVVNHRTYTAQLERTVDEVFGGHTYTDSDRTRPFFPSTSSNYNNSRGLGGCVGTILEHPDLLEGLRTAKGQSITIQQEYFNMHARGRGQLSIVNNSVLLNNFTTLINRITSAAVKEEPLAVPLGLKEKLKVRVITKGPPLIYTAMKPLQLFLHGILRKHPVFCLTGEPTSAAIVQQQMGKTLTPGKKFLSADYSNATNEISSWASEVVVRRIASVVGLTEDELSLALKAMTQHTLVNPSTGETSKQRHGQLMGSVLSFIILCVINATACRWTLELDDSRFATRGLKLRDARLLINGDDALLPVTEDGRTTWELISKYIGLHPSIGKVFYSSRFMNINSMNYLYHPEPYLMVPVLPVYDNETHKFVTSVRGKSSPKQFKPMHFEERKYINFGLVFGEGRVARQVLTAEGDQTVSLGAQCRDLIKNTPYRLREKVLSFFIHQNKENLRKLRCPWFIPERFGGLGLPSVGRWVASDLELRVARKVYENPKLYTVPRIELDPLAWPTWQLACERFPNSIEHTDPSSLSLLDGSVKIEDGIEAISLSRLRTMACIETIFRSDRPLEEFLKKLSKGKFGRAAVPRAVVVGVKVKSRKAPRVNTQTLNKFAIPFKEYRKLQKFNQKVLTDGTVKLPHAFAQNVFPDFPSHEPNSFLLHNTFIAPSPCDKVEHMTSNYNSHSSTAALAWNDEVEADKFGLRTVYTDSFVRKSGVKV